MKHVLVESNRVFEAFAPAHRKGEAAVQRLSRAAAGEVRLHVPAICLREGADAIRRKCTGREARPVQTFRAWARHSALLSEQQSEEVAAFLTLYEVETRQGLGRLDADPNQLRAAAGVDVFALTEECWSAS